MHRTRTLFAFLALFALTPGSTRAEEEPMEIELTEFQREDFEDDLAHIDGTSIKLAETVLFHFAETRIRRRSRPTLQRVADLLKAHPEITRVQIEGHTDYVGTPATNQQLSEDRADTIRAWLIAHGVHPDRLTTVGYGEERPKVPGTSGRKRQINRRVEFILTLQGTPIEDRFPGLAEVVYQRGSSRLYTEASAYTEVTPRQRFEVGAALATAIEANLTLRFQDLGRMRIEGDTRLKIVRLDYDPETERRTLAVKLIRGAVELVDAPSSEAVVLSPEGSITAQGASLRAVRRADATLVLLYEGDARAETSTTSRELVAGHGWRLGPDGQLTDLGPLPAAPRVLFPEPDGVRLPSFDGEAVLEVSEDPEFVTLNQRLPVTSEARLTLEGLPERTCLRLRRRDAEDLLGAPGPVYELPRD